MTTGSVANSIGRKKQLTHRISAWGLEKNVKGVERRAIIQSLSPELKSASFETKSIRGRALTKAKLERWMKREGMTFQAARNEQDEVSTALGKHTVHMTLQLCY